MRLLVAARQRECLCSEIAEDEQPEDALTVSCGADGPIADEVGRRQPRCVSAGVAALERASR